MEKSPQVQIEDFMKEVIGLGNYEMAYLFSHLFDRKIKQEHQ